MMIYRNKPEEKMGGGYEGAETLSRALATWGAPIISADAAINPDKLVVDARGRDLERNTGYIQGAVTISKDSIVGGEYRLNATPNTRVLGLDEKWAEEFQAEVESKFRLYAESLDYWIDASRKCTFTDLVRLAVGSGVVTGEVLAAAEFFSKDRTRPFFTAIKMIETDRLSNPHGMLDTKTISGGIEKNFHGVPIRYAIRNAHPTDMSADRFEWTWRNARKPWGRPEIIHIFEPCRAEQTRGVAAMVSVLKQMRMTSKFQDVVLQNAVLNASYAATIESELLPEQVYGQLGANQNSQKFAFDYMTQLGEYLGSAKNVTIDGAKIAHMWPGTKLKLQPVGSIGALGEGFEESLLRHVASALGLSYEQFSRDYTKTNYSSARASMAETMKYMSARKKLFADRFATIIYKLWLEEAISRGMLDTVTAKSPNFYEGLNKDAYSCCKWIGSSSGQINELQETQAAILRIHNNLSTHEMETARLGNDFRDVFAQRGREKKLMAEYDLDPVLSAVTPTAASPLNTDTPRKDKQEQSNDDTDE